MKTSDMEAGAATPTAFEAALADARRRKMVLERAVAQMVAAFEIATGLRVEHITVTRYNAQGAYAQEAKLSCAAKVAL